MCVRMYVYVWVCVWTALFDLFDIVLSVFECMCIFSLYHVLYSADIF